MLSALPLKADIRVRSRHVRFVSIPDIPAAGFDQAQPGGGANSGSRSDTGGCRSGLCKFGIEKDVERSDLAIANNDDIQSGVVWGLAFRA